MAEVDSLTIRINAETGSAVAQLKQITKLLYYLTPLDYGILAGLLLLMSLLIANRYSRNIFTRSAMKAFREGA